MIILFLILIVVASAGLAFMVLVQNPKGGGLSGNVGGFSIRTHLGVQAIDHAAEQMRMDGADDRILRGKDTAIHGFHSTGAAIASVITSPLSLECWAVFITCCSISMPARRSRAFNSPCFTCLSQSVNLRR